MERAQSTEGKNNNLNVVLELLNAVTIKAVS
jgi:hypothetical protein